MKVAVEIASRGLSFQLQPEALDAPPPLDRVWFRFDRWVRSDALRLSLVAFALVEELIGNQFTLEGVVMPAHLAAALQHRFAGHELFIQGISNEHRLLGREWRYQRLRAPGDTAPLAEDEIAVRCTELGFEFVDAQGELLGRWASNLALYLSLSAREPQAVLHGVLYLLALDAFLVRGTARPVARSLALDCLVEVGGEAA